MTKNGEPHRFHLPQLALEVLEARRRAQAEAKAKGDPAMVTRVLAAGAPKCGLVFPAPASGRPIDTFSDIKPSFRLDFTLVA
ncbi:MAG: hypothetical protein ACJ8AI_02490 [Rhodopila sp.]